MIRLTLLSLLLAGLIVYSWKDWYKSLCGLVLLMAVVEHPDMPKSIMGIQGLNPWNICFAFIFIAWRINRKKEGLTWDMPRHINVLLVLYLGMILVGFFRLLYGGGGGLASIYMGGNEFGMSKAAAVSEYLINSIKWVIPGLALYDGCRDRKRLYLALACVLGLYFFLGLQVIKWMPLSEAGSGSALSDRSLKILLNEIGYHRVNMSMMLAGAAWAVLATRILVKNPVGLVLVVLASFTIVFAQALTGGRTGYATWALVGFILCVIRWRKLLLLVPVFAVIIMIAVPGAVGRMTKGFTAETRDTNAYLDREEITYRGEGPDLYTVTAGRNIAWTYVIPKIGESPWIGHGRMAMQTTGISVSLWHKTREVFPHPHNAYLELLLDNGMLGFVIVISFYLIVLRKSFALFRSKASPVYSAVGGVALALVLSLLIASIGSQSFYPREGSVGMWCGIGLMLRVWTDRQRSLRAQAEAGEGAAVIGNPWMVQT